MLVAPTQKKNGTPISRFAKWVSILVLMDVPPQHENLVTVKQRVPVFARSRAPHVALPRKSLPSTTRLDAQELAQPETISQNLFTLIF
jgi:hypothetical protein